MVNNKKIIYYTHVCYMDFALEFIKDLCEMGYEVYVIIELTQEKLHTNIFDIDVQLSDYSEIISYEDVKQKWDIKYIEEYFSKCKNVCFSVYKHKSLTDLIKVSYKLYKHISKINPDFIHLDDISPRQFLLYPLFIFSKYQLILNIHDSKPHIGEFEWKRFVCKKVLALFIKTYVFYSEYCHSDYTMDSKKFRDAYVLRLRPYTVFRKFKLPDTMHSNLFANIFYTSSKPITFIGRISPYKGIEVFVKAIELLVETYPLQCFIIAGKKVDNYTFSVPERLFNNVTIFERYLKNEELVEIITASQLIVCPYIEATQSGVVMTATALNCPIIVTNIGGLPEYVNDGITGYIVNDVTPESLSEKIMQYIREEKSISFRENLEKQRNTQLDFIKNKKLLAEIYN